MSRLPRSANHRRQPARVAVVLPLVLLLVGGCARAQFGSNFAEDGTATHSVMIVFDRGSMDAEVTGWVETRLTETEEQARADGFTVERIDTDREVGVRISNATLNGADAGAALNALINSIALDQTPGPVAPFQGSFSTEAGAVGGAVFQLDMTVDGAELMTVAAALLPPGERLPEGDELSSALRMSYVVVMPGRVRDSNGQLVRESTVRWDLPHDSQLAMRAESKLGNEGSTTWFLLAAIGSVAGVIAIAGGIGFLLLRRRGSHLASNRPPIGDASVRSEPVPGPPETLAEAGSTLARAVGRVVSGENVASVVGQPDDAPPEDIENR